MTTESNEPPGLTSSVDAEVPATEPNGRWATEDSLRDELRQTRDERDAAIRKLDRRERWGRVGRKARHLALGVLVVLFSLLLPLSVTLGWVRSSIVSTDGWVRTVGNIPSEPAVASAVGTQLADQVFSALQVQQHVSSALPPRATFLAAPITSGVKGYVEQGMTRAVGSPQFHTLWVEANRFAHSQLIAVLEGHSRAVTTTDGQVVLDLVPLLNAGLSQMEGVISGIVGRPVNLPTLTANDVPASACARIGSALGVALPTSCAQIPLFPADNLTQAQQLVRRLHRLVTALFIITPVVAAIALWASDRRRRTGLQLLVGGIIGLVVFRRVLIWLRNTLVATGNPANQEARHAILSHVLHGFFLATTWFLVGAVVVTVVLALTGPYAWARAVRHEVAHVAAIVWGAVVAAGRALAGQAAGDRSSEWIAGHVVLLQVGGIVLALILLLAVPLSFIGLLMVVVLLAAYELLLERFKHRDESGPGVAVGGSARRPAEPR